VHELLTHCESRKIPSEYDTQQNEKNHTTDKIRTVGIAPSEMFMLSSCVCLDSQTIAAALLNCRSLTG